MFCPSAIRSRKDTAALFVPRYAGPSYLHYAYKNGDKRHAYNDRDHDHDKFHNRHRVFRNGVWVWVYGPVTPPMVTIVIGCAVWASSLEARIGGIATTPAWATTTTESERLD